MFKTTLRSPALASFAAALMLPLAAGCAHSNAGAVESTASGDYRLPELDSLYANATRHHRRAVRKPVRDQQRRAMEQLADKAEQLAMETNTWDQGPRLVGLSDPGRETLHLAVDDFRVSLEGLSTAAGHGNVSSVKQQFAAAKANYRLIVDTVGPIE